METNAAAYLKPLGMGQIIDRAVRLYRHNFLQYVGIVALAQIPIFIFSVTFSLAMLGIEDTTLNMSAESIMGLGVLSMVAVLLGALFTQVAVAAMTQAIADTYLGQPTGILEAFSRIGRAWIQLLLVLLAATFIFFGLMIWSIVPCVGWLTGPGMAIFGLAVVVPLLIPIVVLERCSAGEAIGRAWQLARRRFWWLLGFMLLLSLLSQVVVTGPSFLLAWVATPLVEPVLGSVATNVMQSVGSALLNILYLPLYTACVVLLYFDVRIRTEGFDLAMLAAGRQADTAETGHSPQMVSHLPAAPAAAESAMPSQNELVYFVMLSAGILLLYVLLIGLFMLLIISAASLFPGAF
jgi:hypothetical protein